MNKNLYCIFILLFLFAGTTQGKGIDPKLGKQLNWPSFLKQHDPIWEVLPQKFDHGAFLGNGLMGAVLYQDQDSSFRWEVGHSGVTEHRRDNNRLPIGGMVLKTVGRIVDGSLRLDLWNAEVTGTIKTDRGIISIHSYVHAQEMVLITELKTTAGEQESQLKWDAAVATDFRNQDRYFKGIDAPNPAAVLKKNSNNIEICTQKRYAGGMYATVWKEQRFSPNRRIFMLNVSDSYPEYTAEEHAVKQLETLFQHKTTKLTAIHRAWWHAYYPASFVSVPDAQIEGFYWIQMYKLASATRQDRMVLDLLGPWFRKTGWPRVWWNLNIQIAYSPVYTANHLELGESFTRMLDRNKANFFVNGKEIWGFDHCATVSHTTCNEGLRGDGSCAPDKYLNPGDFTWALHNYWLQYRYSMNEQFVVDTLKHAFYPLLKGSVNLYLCLLKSGEDGKLHLPVLHSPEYGDDQDNNYNLSLLRWGCKTLLELNKRYAFHDSQQKEWERVLEQLVDYPQDKNGYRVGAKLSFEKSHRHWSHLMMVWPLYLVSPDLPEERELVVRSLTHWLTVQNGKQIFGWSNAAASILYAAMGNGEQALRQLQAHHNNKRFVMPNTQYIEGDPVIECSFFAAKSLQDMLLQSWGGKLRIFPAIPEIWKDVIFHDLRAEGAFLISASRKAGLLEWFRVKSLVGEPCVIQLTEEIERDGFDKQERVEVLGNGIYRLNLKAGEELQFCRKGAKPQLRPVSWINGKANAWGVKR